MSEEGTFHSAWDDPKVQAALKSRDPGEISLVACQRCGNFGYYVADFTGHLGFNVDSETADGFCYKVTYLFEYRAEGWQPQILDQGLMVLDGGGKLVKATDEDVEDVNSPIPLKRRVPLHLSLVRPRCVRARRSVSLSCRSDHFPRIFTCGIK